MPDLIGHLVQKHREPVRRKPAFGQKNGSVVAKMHVQRLKTEPSDRFLVDLLTDGDENACAEAENETIRQLFDRFVD